MPSPGSATAALCSTRHHLPLPLSCVAVHSAVRQIWKEGNSTMAEPHVVSALVAKRSEVAGLIADLERKAAQQRADLVHVDAVLRLYAPELEPDCIPSRAARRRNGWFKHVLAKAGVG